MSFFEGIDHSRQGKFRPFIQKHDCWVVVYSIQLGKYFWDQFIKVYILFLVLMIVTKSSSADLVDLLIYSFNRLNQFAERCLEFDARQKRKFSLGIALFSKVRKTLSGTKYCLFLPLDSHLGNKAFIVFIEFEGDINSTDEITNGIVFKVNIEKIVSAEQSYRIIDDFLKFERVIELFLASPHEVNELGKLHLCYVMLIDLLQFMHSILLQSKFVNFSQLFLREQPLCLHKVTIIHLMKMQESESESTALIGLLYV